MIDYFSFQAGSTYPTLAAVLYTVLLAFLLSTAIALTYYFTTPKSRKTQDFFQALVLSALVASTVMQAIGDSLAVGLGMLGALAIIRFRTNLENPRDIIFMFATLAAGLACGVYGFVIASVGSIAFCLVAWLLKFSSSTDKEEIKARLRFRLPQGAWEASQIEPILKKTCLEWKMGEVRLRQANEEEADGPPAAQVEYLYRLVIRDEAAYARLVEQMQKVPDISNLRINVDRAIRPL